MSDESVMRQQGILADWNDDRGFGFITPVAAGPRVFVHISAFPRGQRPATTISSLTAWAGTSGTGLAPPTCCTSFPLGLCGLAGYPWRSPPRRCSLLFW